MADQSEPAREIIEFEASSEGAAMTKAEEWIRDFTKHPSIYIQRLTVVKDGNKFVAIVLYSLAN